MSYKRYYITAGAKTTAGGIVKASNQLVKINGAPQACEGDPVECPACGTQGLIQCIQPRLPDSFNGKQFALSDDLCICNCSVPPKLAADQHFKYQTHPSTSAESVTAAEVTPHAMRINPTSVPTASAQDNTRLTLRFVCDESEEAHASQPYHLKLADGTVVHGTTDADGRSRPLTQTERNALTAAQEQRP